MEFLYRIVLGTALEVGMTHITLSRPLAGLHLVSRVFVLCYLLALYLQGASVTLPSLTNAFFPIVGGYVIVAALALTLARNENLEWWPWCELFCDLSVALYASLLFPGSPGAPVYLPVLLGLGLRLPAISPFLLAGIALFFLFNTAWLATTFLSKPSGATPFSIGAFLPAVSFFLATALAVSLGQRFRKRDEERDALLTLIRAGQELGATLNFTQVTDLLFDVLSTMFYCHSCGLYMKEDRGERTVMTLKGIATSFKKEYPDFDLDFQESILPKVIKEKQARIIKDLQEQHDPLIPHERAYRSLILAPICFRDELLGLLFLVHSIPNLYTDQDAELLSLLSNQIAVCLKNISLYQTTAKMAVTDSLTSLYTHGYFQDQLLSLIPKAKIDRKSLTLAMLDVDFFKKVNDSYGHPQGDYLLKQLGALMAAQMRPTDLLARYGGDEFSISLPETDKMTGALMMERLRRAVEEYQFMLGNRLVKVTVSIGVASVPDSASTAKELIEAADTALYESKTNGRNRVTYK